MILRLLRFTADLSNEPKGIIGVYIYEDIRECVRYENDTPHFITVI